ncbi:hypothetical protein PORY_002467 [Pneumocystis oryctolagi]|uniref:Uncharacterized protein n=1 Tax=Pneumocystis oryctolagi TaxID=42067 RepID=A0ACB7CB13_9ASCO|nr:hypothetical protein PORY_002467 [Pneumocystis oryctolagi]
MEEDLQAEIISAGCNSSPNVSDWSPYSGYIAFGTHHNVALYDPFHEDYKGIFETLRGHKDFVTVVRFFWGFSGGKEGILSGSSDSTVKIWKKKINYFECVHTITEHKASVNILAALGSYITVGAADGLISVWEIKDSDTHDLIVNKIQVINSVNMFPLAMSLYFLPNVTNMLFVVSGSSNLIDVYVSSIVGENHVFSYVSSLDGHSDWVRGLDITTDQETGDLLLSSSSQDKYIRIWRITRISVSEKEENVINEFKNNNSETELFLTNKIFNFSIEEKNMIYEYSIFFDALLMGHDDWVFTCSWHPGNQLKLLTASSDTSLIIWHPDNHSGIWVSECRVGELCFSKGASTATGSFGGFFGGLWGPDGKNIACWGKSGGWRIFSNIKDNWIERLSITGHVKAVKSISWSPGGEFLVSSSLDQTTRLFAPWIRQNEKGKFEETWHEFSRPQIHGYDINCVNMLDTWQLISGADEKVIRIFNPIKPVARLILKLSNLEFDKRIDNLSDAANVPLLGLSNKAINSMSQVSENKFESIGNNNTLTIFDKNAGKNDIDFKTPPFEEHLQVHTLWPEVEKLYAHGYEIISVSSSHDKTLIASTCKATTSEHAVLRLFDTSTWQEILPPLSAHTLTVTRVQFSEDDKYILSVGRDRTFALFVRTDEKNVYKLIETKVAHSRIIWDCCWAPKIIGNIFVTASRDKTVKIWKLDVEKTESKCLTTLKLPDAVTSIDICPYLINNSCFLAIGMESGVIVILKSSEKDVCQWRKVFDIPEMLLPGASISRIQWRPLLKLNTHYIGVASEDQSVRIYKFKSKF